MNNRTNLQEMESNLQSIISKRDAKRKQVENLYDQIQLLRKQKDDIEEELYSIDVNITELETQIVQERQQNPIQQINQQSNHFQQQQQQTANTNYPQDCNENNGHHASHVPTPTPSSSATIHNPYNHSQQQTANTNYPQDYNDYNGHNASHEPNPTPSSSATIHNPYNHSQQQTANTNYPQDYNDYNGHNASHVPNPTHSSSATIHNPYNHSQQQTANTNYPQDYNDYNGHNASHVPNPTHSSSATPHNPYATTQSSRQISNNTSSSQTRMDQFVVNNNGGNSLAPPNSLFANNHNNYNSGNTAVQNPYMKKNNQQNSTTATTTTSTSRNPYSDQITNLLHNTFNIQSFRDHQKDIIEATLEGKDVFVIMRTGGGKSLTYQLPALLEGRYLSEQSHQPSKITVVISPLISLIQDQEEQMNMFADGSATSLTSGIGTSEHARRWQLVRNPNSGLCLILVTPEKVHSSNKLRGELEKLNAQNRIGRFVIDECHCASQWGHDFRPDYTKLGILKTHFPKVPVLAVTATASERVKDDVCRILRINTRNPNTFKFFRSLANRPNLNYSVQEKAQGKDKVALDIRDFIQQKHPRNAGIIYTFSRNEADELSAKLNSLGISSASYHSSVSAKEKERIHKSWMKDRTQVIVATIAFGLGINKPDVRFVLHHSLSKSLENYYQESGRAGRDGKPADCVLYYAPKDVPRMVGMIHGDNGENSFWGMVRYAQAKGTDIVCRNIIHSVISPDEYNKEVVLNRPDDDLTIERDVTTHAKTVTELVHYQAVENDLKTLNQLVTIWRSNDKYGDLPDCVKANKPGRDLTKDECERVIVSLMLEDILEHKVMYNAYSSSMYIIPGPNAQGLLLSENPEIKIRFPRRGKKGSKGTPQEDEDGEGETEDENAPAHSTHANKSSTKRKTTKKKQSKGESPEKDTDGWISTKKSSKSKKSTRATKKKTISKASTTSKTKRSSSNNKKKKGSEAKITVPKSNRSDIIEVLISSSSEDELEIVQVQPSHKANTSRKRISKNDDDLLLSSSSEEKSSATSRSSRRITRTTRKKTKKTPIAQDDLYDESSSGSSQEAEFEY